MLLSYNIIDMVLLIEDLLTIQNLIEKNTYVLIDFTASWCGPCKRIGPIFEELSPQYTNVTCVKVDVDCQETKPLCKLCKVRSMPTFMLVKEGTIIDQFSGASKEDLVRLLQMTTN